ncbi:MAG: fructosamine kinase family protein [Pseudomonadota bacterium]
MHLSKESLQEIGEWIGNTTGKTHSIDRIQETGGGCISSAFTVNCGPRQYFLKVDDTNRFDMLESEAEGLAALQDAGAVRVPEVICTGQTRECTFIVLEYIMFVSSSGGQSKLGGQLARLHRTTAAQFGWGRDNYIGATPQPNSWHDDWLQFFSGNRLAYQLSLAAVRINSPSLQTAGNRLLEIMGKLFVEYRPQPSLLHGDLWGGNYGIDENENPVIFDPAVYYGDREADLAMTELFGGFGAEFYEAYQKEWPPDAGYPLRKNLYTLYHILNHANLFGGGYILQAERIASSLVAEIEKL